MLAGLEERDFQDEAPDDVEEQGVSSPAADTPPSEDAPQPLTLAQVHAALEQFGQSFDTKLQNLYRGIQSQVTPTQQANAAVRALRDEMLMGFDAIYKAVLPKEQYEEMRENLKAQAEQRAKDARLAAYEQLEKARRSSHQQLEQEADVIVSEWNNTYRPLLQRVAAKLAVPWESVEADIVKLEGRVSDDDPTGWLGITEKAEGIIQKKAQELHRQSKRAPAVAAGARPAATGANPLHDFYAGNPTVKAWLAKP